MSLIFPALSGIVTVTTVPPPSPAVIARLPSHMISYIPITVATATDKYLIVGALKHLGIIHYFKDVISCTDIGEGKTSPKIYIECCNIMNTVPVDTLVVEDSLSALTTAKNADFKTMAVFDITQKRFWEKLQALADYAVKNNFTENNIMSVL